MQSKSRAFHVRKVDKVLGRGTTLTINVTRGKLAVGRGESDDDKVRVENGRKGNKTLFICGGSLDFFLSLCL